MKQVGKYLMSESLGATTEAFTVMLPCNYLGQLPRKAGRWDTNGA